MKEYYDLVMESVDAILSMTAHRPRIAMILGSGLGKIVDVMEDMQEISYATIPNFPVSTVEGHKGCLAFGRVNGVEILIMMGRFHYYEGYSMKEVAYPVFVMKQLGIEKLIITNACGGINESFEPGDLMLLTDYINFMPSNPLIGANDERFGPRFPDMSEPYSMELIGAAKAAADRLKLSCQEGIYAGFMGPCFETAAEIRMLHTMGADAVGMSTVPETMAANYLGMKVLGIGCITNMATGIQKMKHSHERVLMIANQASDNLSRWILAFLKDIA